MKKVQEIQMERLHAYLDSKITSAGQADYPNEAVMVLEVLLRHSPALRFVTTGSKSGGSFYSNVPGFSLPAGLAVHSGKFILMQAGSRAYEWQMDDL